MVPEMRLKIRNFFKKYGSIILIVLVIWGIILLINYFVGHRPEKQERITTYEPHKSVMDSTSVPEKLKDPIENKINEFIKNCNEKKYDDAYEMLSKECRDNVFEDIDTFKEYVDSVFDEKKIYNIQDFSNDSENGIYIYTVTILEDIMVTGLTNETGLETYEETFVFKNEDNDLKLSIRGFIDNKKVDKMYEDNYIKIKVESVKIDYETMTYTINVRNKTDGVVVLDDQSGTKEISLNVDGEARKRYGMYLEPIVVNKGETKTFELTFMRFYDEKFEVKSLGFNDIRILKSYTGEEETRQSELDNAIARFKVTFNL